MPALYNNQVFPGGNAKTLIITATAGNVVTNLSPGVGMRWIIQRARLVLVCDITVANRNILPDITDGANIIERLIASPNVVASGTGTFTMGSLRVNASGNVYDTALIGIGELVLSGLEQFRISIINGVAGDSYTGYVSVREMTVD